MRFHYILYDQRLETFETLASGRGLMYFCYKSGLSSEQLVYSDIIFLIFSKTTVTIITSLF